MIDFWGSGGGYRVREVSMKGERFGRERGET